MRKYYRHVYCRRSMIGEVWKRPNQETLAMSTLSMQTDELVESKRLLAALEQRRDDMPFAKDLLVLHRPAHQELEGSRAKSEAAIDAWRAALACRWECEVAGRRLYKRILRELTWYYGSPAALEVQMISRGDAEVNSSPSELLFDLRRVQAALSAGAIAAPLASEWLTELEQTCAALDAAITATDACEATRRVAAMNNRMAQDAYRRIRSQLRQLLATHYGEGAPSEFAGIFE